MAVIATGPPGAVRLLHHVERAAPLAGRAANHALVQHRLELPLGGRQPCGVEPPEFGGSWLSPLSGSRGGRRGGGPMRKWRRPERKPADSGALLPPATRLRREGCRWWGLEGQRSREGRKGRQLGPEETPLVKHERRPLFGTKLYTDFILDGGGFSAVLGAALAPPHMYIYIYISNT